MKPYGIKREDFGCCPGHDKFSLERYASRTSEHARARDKRLAHKIARARVRAEMHKELRDVRSQ